ncbi:GNAT family N-acetyltransferase [Arenibacter sp. GZD96]|uniref:GNAT family N-acetyltransferase n=1 Tax=Aurantibrevibacter litoralis TaxID=3106030 RepID=UPI002AFF7D10|nr:GNAT family N-acetyltransferase [Arenibacter sp. GZD-96]MEA1787237.1 GNAT family N-acetyltransferase [Arenibacter sp. GZD-96]
MMMITRVTNEDELKQILALQQKNLLTGIPLAEKEKEGFVTVAHTLALLEQMNKVCAHIIAKDQDKVVGYALCMHVQFAEEIEILQPMFREIETVLPKNEMYLVMGQICIEKAYRKMGIFRKLYETMANAVKLEYRHIITEVDAQNERSLQAHYAVGFKDLKKYTSGGQDWKLIGLEAK